MDKKIFYKVSYGLYVIASANDGKLNGQIANTVFQISSEPPTVAISINKNNLTHELIQKSKSFSVSILPKSAPLKFIGHFGFKSGREIDKFQEISFKTGLTGAPILLETTLGYLEAQVINSMDAGTHTVFVGKVINAEVLDEEEPMTYAYYQQVKKGSVPPAAPSYIKTEPNGDNTVENKKEDVGMKKYQCGVCGYIYDPEKGDPDSGIVPGTAFEDIPEDWVCPVCGVAKDQFEPI